MTVPRSDYWVHEAEAELWNTYLLQEAPDSCDVICVSDGLVK
jgi:hypothetical protein